jgi:hypothetical protein
VSGSGKQLQEGWRKAMSRLSLGLGLAVGYVLGARAGRARFEQIRTAAVRLSEQPAVQEALSRVQSAVPAPLQDGAGALSRRTSWQRVGTPPAPPSHTTPPDPFPPPGGAGDVPGTRS